MKRILFTNLVLLIFLSCSKEENIQNKELQISYKTEKSIEDVSTITGVIFYPNPFHDIVSCQFGGSGEALIRIFNEEGLSKEFRFYESVSLDFSKEKSGVYYCEVLANNTVYKTYLIKK